MKIVVVAVSLQRGIQMHILLSPRRMVVAIAALTITAGGCSNHGCPDVKIESVHHELGLFNVDVLRIQNTLLSEFRDCESIITIYDKRSIGSCGVVIRKLVGGKSLQYQLYRRIADGTPVEFESYLWELDESSVAMQLYRSVAGSLEADGFSVGRAVLPSPDRRVHMYPVADAERSITGGSIDTEIFDYLAVSSYSELNVVSNERFDTEELVDIAIDNQINMLDVLFAIGSGVSIYAQDR